MAQLDNVLVLCLAYSPPGMQTARFLLDLQKWGATVHIVRGPADIALARSVAAAAAETYIKECSYLEYVLFLDNDVWASPEAVQQLVRLCQDLAIPLKIEPSVSGLYLNRHKRDKTAAAQKLKDFDPIPCGADPSLPNVQPVAVYALCGLGAFLMPVGSLVAHCNESERVIWYKATIPIVCRSGPITADELAKYIDGLSAEGDTLYWNGEDFDFCMRELNADRPVLVAPVMFMHSSDVELDPIGSVTFPGLFGPKSTEESKPADESPA
jgi:hypothetical protein